ncbi:MAG: hypothetical protein MJZ15_10190 [Bacteroidales bacterium]|nr:hypothetical protein [Bacteroidales bacterium]
MRFVNEIKELLHIIKLNHQWAVRSFFEGLVNLYYSVSFHLTKVVEVCRRPVNLVVDTVTVIAALWCIGNIIWQIGFDITPETAHSLLVANRNIIALFAFIQVYKLITYIHASAFSPFKTAVRRANSIRSRQRRGRSVWRSVRLMWHSFVRKLFAQSLWQRIRQLFAFLFVGNVVPVGEVLYSLGNCLYSYYMPPIDAPLVGWEAYIFHRYAIITIVAIIAFNELSRLGITILSRRTNPTALFIGSFIIIILIGCGLLLMPKSNDGSLTFFDALFTATSAVCVNGLSIIDIPNQLTLFGQGVLLILIQVGGIGVMTFTCFFALSLTGKASLQNRFVIKDLVSADNMTDMFQMLKRIMVVTFSIEAICAWFIFNYMELRVPDVPTPTLIFYSAFHSISAFCNAGFSNLDGGMMNPLVAGMRPLQLAIAFTVILGGLGFPLQSAVIDWSKHHIKVFFYRLRGKNYTDIFRSRLINANNRIVFYTHIGLLIIGTIIFMLTESHFTQSDSDWLSRLNDSFFLSVCARTAGFNIVDLNLLGPISLLILTGLMWIGCAPLSTGGGIKVTTFAIFMLNIRSVLQRRDTIEVYGRQISDQSIRRAFAVIGLSGFFMLTCAILLKCFDPQIGFAKLMFEASSAVYTGGMTLDVTTHLSLASHIVLLVSMFIGRIGILSFALCFIDPAPKQYYSYPHENVMV